jgi:N-acetylglucosaminyldiphosphoundecaprenol N-acetyl-beta-D-mannosaminyltransferase
MDLPFIDFFGLKVSVFSKSELIDSMEHTIVSPESKVYYGYSLAALLYFKKYPTYHSITSQFDVMVTDGRMFYLLAKLFGYKLKLDISIPRLTLLAVEVAHKHNLKLLIIGGTSDTYNLALRNLAEKYKGIQFCKGRDGYFKPEEKEKIYGLVKQEKPNILLLGFPTPAKQSFAYEIRDRLTSCVIIPCGGMIDVFAGKEKLTPKWIKKIGLASIYRHIQHPKRLSELFYIYFLTLKVFLQCFVKKYIFRHTHINITELV